MTRERSGDTDLVSERHLRISNLCGKVVYLVVALILLLIAIGIIVFALTEIWGSYRAGSGMIQPLLDAIGLTVLGLAVIDVSKYILDEEVIRSRELRAASEARAALTKFFTIITIAISLEAVVLVFGATKSNAPESLIFPVFLLLTAVAIVSGLGVFQWLSAKTEELTADKS